MWKMKIVRMLQKSYNGSIKIISRFIITFSISSCFLATENSYTRAKEKLFFALFFMSYEKKNYLDWKNNSLSPFGNKKAKNISWNKFS